MAEANIFDQFDEENEKKRVANPFTVLDKEKPSIKGRAQEAMTNRPKAAYEILKNAPESVMKLLGELSVMAQHPGETIKGAIETVGSGLEMGGRKLEELYMGEDIAPDPEKELLANTVIDQVKEDWGGGDEMANRLLTDPAGFMFDVGIPAKRADPFSIAGRRAQDALTSGNVAEKMYSKAAGIPPSMLDEGAAIAQTGLREKLPVSKKGFESINQGLDQIGAQIDDIIRGDPLRRDMPIPSNVVQKYLDALIKDSRYVDDLGDLKTLENLRDNFSKQFGDKPTIFPDELQKWKTNVYNKAYTAKTSPDPLVAKGIQQKGQRTQGRGAKEALEMRFPELKKPNGEFAEYAQLKPFVEKRINQMADMGGHDAFMTMYQQTLNNPSFKSNLALYLDRMAKGDLNLLEKTLTSAELRTVIALSGRNQQMIEEETTMRTP